MKLKYKHVKLCIKIKGCLVELSEELIANLSLINSYKLLGKET